MNQVYNHRGQNELKVAFAQSDERISVTAEERVCFPML